MLFLVPATGLAGLLLCRQNDESTLSEQTLLTWTTISTIREIRVNREAWDNWNAFFFSFPPSLASAIYLCASYTLYVLDVSPTVTAHAYSSQLRPLFYFSPSAPSPCSLCPSTFPGDFISPISNRIGSQFAMLHVTLPAEFHTWYRRIIKLQNEQNMICQNFSLPFAICHFRYIYFSPFWFVVKEWRRGIGQMEVSIKKRGCCWIGVEAGRGITVASDSIY